MLVSLEHEDICKDNSCKLFRWRPVLHYPLDIIFMSYSQIVNQVNDLLLMETVMQITAVNAQQVLLKHVAYSTWTISS